MTLVSSPGQFTPRQPGNFGKNPCPHKVDSFLILRLAVALSVSGTYVTGCDRRCGTKCDVLRLVGAENDNLY